MANNLSKVVTEKAKNTKLLILDVDGVLTDGSLYFDNQGQEYKAFNSKDGHGIRLLLENDVQVAIITGRKSELVMHRAKNLQIPPEMIYQGHRDKRAAFKDLVEKTGIPKEHIAYIGDDVIDLPVMSQTGFSIAVADANDFVKKHADWTTQEQGGKGAVRELCECILEAQEKLDDIFNAYLQ